MVLLQQRPVIGDQQAQRNDSVRRYYLPDDSRHFRSPPGLSCNKIILINSGVGEEGNFELCATDRNISPDIRSLPRSFLHQIEPSWIEYLCPFFCVEPRQPPCKLDVTRNAFNVIEEGLLVWAGQETHLGVAEREREQV